MLTCIMQNPYWLFCPFFFVRNFCLSGPKWNIGSWPITKHALQCKWQCIIWDKKVKKKFAVLKSRYCEVLFTLFWSENTFIFMIGRKLWVNMFLYLFCTSRGGPGVVWDGYCLSLEDWGLYMFSSQTLYYVPWSPSIDLT